ncbi:hypothetical protein [Enterococcus faecium]|uniref:hypothetical protein n=1 Tax=Enterococcus faecium TaxID=1352 RepID=UPI001E4B121A|nr:hypothetical protein [Enterococcus faecium]
MVKAEVGRSYICKPIGVSHELIGCIERTYINTAVVYVESYDQRDYQLINESKYRVKSRLLCKMLYNVFTISTYQN